MTRHVACQTFVVGPIGLIGDLASAPVVLTGFDGRSDLPLLQKGILKMYIDLLLQLISRFGNEFFNVPLLWKIVHCYYTL